MPELLAVIEQRLTETYGAQEVDTPLLTRERHRQAIARARAEVEEFRGAWHGRTLPAPVAAVHLRAAEQALESLIGAVDVEDVLDRVFSSFCVGK
jgi:tRNA modification GTPase